MKSDREIYLDVLTTTVGRLSGYSFAAKGWVVTIAAAFVGLAISSKSPALAYSAIVPTAFFWLIDAYYLMLERRYRYLFDIAFQAQDLEKSKMTFDHRIAKQFNRIAPALFSAPLVVFYGAIGLSLSLFPFLIK